MPDDSKRPINLRAMHAAKWPALFGVLLGFSAGFAAPSSLSGKLLLGLITSAMLAGIFGGATYLSALVVLSLKHKK